MTIEEAKKGIEDSGRDRFTFGLLQRIGHISFMEANKIMAQLADDGFLEKEGSWYVRKREE